ncbi:Surfactin synthase subunit 1, partial [Penicillium subrubescens]
RRLLALDKTHDISCFDNFAALGGHSLLQLALVARLKKIFHIPITLNDVTRASSLRGLANYIQTYDSAQSNTISGDLLGDQSRSLGLDDPSPTELEWIYRYQNSEERSSFNMPYVAKLSSKIDQQLLKLALEKVLNRHRILRSRFTTQEGKTKRSLSPNAIIVPLIDDVDITAFI